MLPGAHTIGMVISHLAFTMLLLFRIDYQLPTFKHCLITFRVFFVCQVVPTTLASQHSATSLSLPPT
jgi:hypothetical protein